MLSVWQLADMGDQGMVLQWPWFDQYIINGRARKQTASQTPAETPAEASETGRFDGFVQASVETLETFMAKVQRRLHHGATDPLSFALSPN